MGRAAPKPSPLGGNDYEAQRAARIAANKQRLQELGIMEEVKAMADDARKEREAIASKKVPNPARKSRDEYKQFLADCPIRRSARNVDKSVNYALDDPEELKHLPRKRKVNLLGTTGDIMMLAEETRTRMEGIDGVEKGGWDSGRGVRWQGGRIYDSKYGVTCHWCRQKTLEDHVTCTHPNCGNGKRMPTSFCKMCLRNRHGEDVVRAEASGIWVCPTCRGTCGEGCRLCCNCGPCRKKAGLAPTHQVIKEARAAGFDNVHDFLVWQSTGKDSETITDYKRDHPWGRWLYEDIVRPPAPPAAEMHEDAPAEEADKENKRGKGRGAAKGSKGTPKGGKGTPKGGKGTPKGGKGTPKGGIAKTKSAAPKSADKSASKRTAKAAAKAAPAAADGAAEEPEMALASKVPLHERSKPLSRKERMMARLGL